jgi:hypothetical protein
MMSSGFLYPASIWSISALSIAIGADSPLPMVGYTVPYTAPLPILLLLNAPPPQGQACAHVFPTNS